MFAKSLFANFSNAGIGEKQKMKTNAGISDELTLPKCKLDLITGNYRELIDHLYLSAVVGCECVCV